MPRSTAYFGPIDSGAVTNSAPMRQSNNAGVYDSLGQGISDLVRVFNYDPARDPKAQQAALYNAQTQGELQKNSREQDTYSRSSGGDMANSQLVQQVGGALQQMPPEERGPALLKFVTDYTANAVKAGQKPDAAYVAARNIINVFDTSGKIATAFDTAVSGQPVSNGSYFTDAQHQADITSGRETERLKLQQTGDNEMAKQKLSNDGSLAVAETAAGANRYGSDMQYKGQMGSAGISAGVSRSNAQLQDATTRRGQDMELKEKTAPRTVTQSKTTVVSKGQVPGPPAAPSGLAALFSKPQAPTAAGVPRPVKDAFPQIPEGAHVTQGGKGYTKVNGQMVPD